MVKQDWEKKNSKPWIYSFKVSVSDLTAGQMVK